MKEVVGDLNQGCFFAMFRVKAKFELFKEIIIIKIDMEFRCNYPLENFGD